MQSLRLANDCLALRVLPEVGGKIASLRSQATGREWLWTNPHLPLGQPVYGDSYIEKHDFGGWDEIFPSVAPARVEGFDIPDHGDLAVLPWEVLSQSATHLTMGVTTRFAPVRFERALTLDGPELRVDYRLTNLGAQTVPYLWCAHPLVTLEPGMTIELPLGATMRVDGGVGVRAGTAFPWPHAPGLSSLDRVPDPSAAGFCPFAAKLFTARGAVGEVTIGTPDGGEKLRMRWSAADTPYLGLWYNCRGWSGCGSAPYFNLGVEPTTAPFDDLGAALQENAGCHLHTGQTRMWSLWLTIH